MKKSAFYIQMGGIGVGILALAAYVLTLEPTASFWDCGEFIACAYHMEIAHPPGAPIFLLLGRIFSLFAGGNTERVAYWVNMLSAVASAATIFFLYHTIIWFIKKTWKTIPNHHTFILIAGGSIGALAFAFTDSFWFSAVEGEVYATSSLFTAIVFWAILKWEESFQGISQTSSFRWLLLIFFLLGLSIGIHLLNLLAIPAIGLIIYFKTRPVTPKGVVLSFLLSALVLAFIVFVFIPGIVKTGTYFDLFAVNVLNTKPNLGFLIYLVVLFAGLIAALSFFRGRRNLLAFQIGLCLTMLLLGYTSYASVVIRSAANPAIDMNDPETPFGLLHYLNREQYGQRSLIKGPYYNAPVLSTEERTSKIYYQGEYIDDPLNPKVTYDPRFLTVFPRMWSNEPEHIEAYKSWGRIKGEPVSIQNRQGKQETLMKPAFSENLRYFFRYQVGHMYWRYFMWNFVGRQNDIQGFGEPTHGNWLSGVGFIDSLRLGSQSNLPEHMNSNKGKNVYFFLPLFLGLAGLFYQSNTHKHGLWVNLTFFFFTGLAIVIYLNEVPITPRERDYVYVGSFYAFAIWIGLSIPAFIHLLRKYTSTKIALPGVTLVIFLAGPVLLFSQNLDDHNRSNRYIARDVGYNYLQSCRKNAILFTSADNDTYPLWYVQEVEGIRTDIRQVLQPYLSANWYIEQQKKDRPGSKGLPISFSAASFLSGQRDYIPVLERVKNPIPLDQLLDFVRSDNIKSRLQQGDNPMDYIPASKYLINLPSTPENPDEVIKAQLKKRYLLKGDLIILDIICQNKWERPIYFFNPQIAQDLGLGDYLVREGLAYRLVPYKNSSKDAYDPDYNYELFTRVYRWGNLENPDVYADWTIRRNIGLVLRIRDQYSQLANKLLQKSDTLRAKQVMDVCIDQFPGEQLPYDMFTISTIDTLLQLDEKAKAMKIFNQMYEQYRKEIAYYSRLNDGQQKGLYAEIQRAMYIWQRLGQLAVSHNLDKAEEIQRQFSTYLRSFGMG